MTRIRLRKPLGALLACALMLGLSASSAQAASAPLTFTVGAGSSFSGHLGGNLTLTLITGTGRVSLSVTSGTLFGGVQVSGTLNINMAGNQTLGMTLNTAQNQFNVAPTGTFTVGAEDTVSDGVSGVLDASTPGPDGRWDDQGDSVFENVSLNNIGINVPNIAAVTTVSTNNITGAVSGTIGGILPTTGNVRFGLASVTGGLNGLAVNSTGTADVLGGLAQTDVFGDGSHVLGDPTLQDLSGDGTVAAPVNVTGTVNANVLGNVGATLTALGGLLTLYNGNILTNSSLGSINEAINLAEILPALLQLMHHDTLNVDYDNAGAVVQASTLGQTVSIPISLPATVVPFTQAIARSTSGSGSSRVVTAGNIVGSLTYTITGTLTVDAAVLLNGNTLNNVVNVNIVPEPTSVGLLALGALGFIPFAWRRVKKNRKA